MTLSLHIALVLQDGVFLPSFRCPSILPLVEYRNCLGPMTLRPVLYLFMLPFRECRNWVGTIDYSPLTVRPVLSSIGCILTMYSLAAPLLFLLPAY